MTIRTMAASARRNLLLAGACVTLGIGCASLAKASFKAPDVDLAEVQLLGIGLSGGTLNLVVDVYNPNDYQITGGRLQAGLSLENTYFGSILIERAVTLPANDTAVVEVPLQFTWGGVGAGARAFLRSGSALYELDGSIIAETPIGTHEVPVKKTGTVTLRDLM